MFTETEKVALCKPYLKSLKKWDSAVFIPMGQSQFLPWGCPTVIPSFFRRHQYILIMFYMHVDSMNVNGWINFITWSGIHGSRRPEGHFCLTEKYLYLHHLWKICVLILLKFVSEEDPTKSAYCLCYVSFIFLNIFLMCNLHFPWWLNWFMWTDFFLSYKKYNWWHSHWPHYTIL